MRWLSYADLYNLVTWCHKKVRWRTFPISISLHFWKKLVTSEERSTRTSRLTKCVRQQKFETRAGTWDDQSSTWSRMGKKRPVRMRVRNGEVTDSQKPKHCVPAAAKAVTAQIKRRHWAEVSYWLWNRLFGERNTLQQTVWGNCRFRIDLFTPCVSGK
jgi:hypothetical protein